MLNMCVCFETSWLACYVQVKLACVDFGRVQPFLPLHNNSPCVIWLYVCMLLRSHHNQSHVHTHVWMFFCGRRWAGSPGCCRQSADFRGRAGNTVWNVFWSALFEPSESFCWRPFPVHTLQPGPFVSFVCVAALPFLPLVEPPVPGMFHPSRSFFFRMPNLNNESYFLYTFKHTYMHRYTHTHTHRHRHTQRHVIKQSIIFGLHWHHLTRSGVTKQVCILHKGSFVCAWVCLSWINTATCLLSRSYSLCS